MCLRNPEKPPAKYKKGGVGYKVVLDVDGKIGRYTSYSMGHRFNTVGRVNVQRLKSETISVVYTNYSDLTYPCGFHIYLRKKDAKRFIDAGRRDCGLKIIKVSFEDPVAYGFDNWTDYPTIVARRMTILKEVK